MSEEIKQEVTQETKVDEPTQEVKEDTQEQAQEEVKAEEPEKDKETKTSKPNNKNKKDKTKTESKKDTDKKSTAKAETKETESKQEEVKPEKELPPIEYKSLASSSKNIAIHSLMVQIKNGKINLSHSVQRKSSQWSLKQQEKLLLSIIQGVILSAVVIAEQNGERFCLDGKQRLETLYSFCCKPSDPKFNPKLKVFGRSFNELDEQTKDAIEGSNINVVTYQNCTDAEIFELFERYNNGVALSSAQKSRSYCSIRLLNKIKELLDSHFIKEICNITKGSILKDEDTITLIQSAMIASGFDFKSFNNKEVDRFLQEIEENEIMAALDIIEEHIQILDSIVTEKQKNLKKIHLPMILACANSTDEFKNKLLNFLENYENETEYRSFCQGSTSQKENVQGRLNYWNS